MPNLDRNISSTSSTQGPQPTRRPSESPKVPAQENQPKHENNQINTQDKPAIQNYQKAPLSNEQATSAIQDGQHAKTTADALKTAATSPRAQSLEQSMNAVLADSSTHALEDIQNALATPDTEDDWVALTGLLYSAADSMGDQALYNSLSEKLSGPNAAAYKETLLRWAQDKVNNGGQVTAADLQQLVTLMAGGGVNIAEANTDKNC